MKRDWQSGYKVQVPCHYPKCKRLSAPASNYCKRHGEIVRKKYDGTK